MLKSIVNQTNKSILVRSFCTGGPSKSASAPTGNVLRIGDVVPDFTQDSSVGNINFYKECGDKWTILFSHPKDYTPVCTTELGRVAKLKPEFDKRNTKVMALSIDSASDHKGWINDIEETQNVKINYPIIADVDKKVANLYSMVHPNSDGGNFTIRSVYFIAPDKKLRAQITLPASTGRSFDIRLCENGGVSMNNIDCICPPSFFGKNCENKDENEICNQATHPTFSFDSLCCWQKYRSYSNLTEMKITTSIESEFKCENEKIKEILETYGPWRQPDIQLANILFEKNNDTNEFYLKYKNDLKFNKFPYSCNEIENPNPIAFSMMIHKINLESIDQLFQILYKPYHYYVIHVDKSMDDLNLYLKLKEYLEFFENNKKKEFGGLKNYPNNIKLMSERFIGAWGSISLVYMELATYTELFDMVKERSMITNDYSQWSHVINLSLNDMPTISISNLSKQLCENYNTNYLDENCIKEIDRFNKTFIEYQEGIHVSEPYQISDELFEKYECGNSGMKGYYDRTLSSDGSQWHILTSNFANYLIGDIKSIERLFSFKFSNIPDESFFQASKKYYNYLDNDIFTKDSHRVTMWDRNPNRNDLYRYGVFLEDVEKINGNTLFIRKVYTKDVKEAIIKKFNLIE